MSALPEGNQQMSLHRSSAKSAIFNLPFLLFIFFVPTQHFQVCRVHALLSSQHYSPSVQSNLSFNWIDRCRQTDTK